MAMSLLERYDEMQRRPFGTNTALSDGSQYGVGGTAGSQFRRQEQAYGRALRLLDRQARRGDVKSALTAIDVRNKAMESGYTPGGIRRKAEADQGLITRVETAQMEARADAAKAALERQSALDKAAGEAGGESVFGPFADEDNDGVPDTLDKDAPKKKSAIELQSTVNPNATAGAGRGRPIGLASRWDSYRNRMA